MFVELIAMRPTGVFSVQMKNWEPLVSGPELAMDRTPAECVRDCENFADIGSFAALVTCHVSRGSPGPVCRSRKFSSRKLSPKMETEPVPSPWLRSPPWAMNPGMMRWKVEPGQFLRNFVDSSSYDATHLCSSAPVHPCTDTESFHMF